MQRDSNKQFMQARALWVLKGWGRAGCRTRVGSDVHVSDVEFVWSCKSATISGVGDHIRRRGKGGGNIAQFNMLAAEVDAHVDVA